MGKRLGMWMQWISELYNVTALDFVNTYFKTPPYFSCLEIIFPIWHAQWGNFTAWVDSVAELADELNVEIYLMIALGLHTQEHLDKLTTFAEMAQRHISIYSIGIDCEHANLHYPADFDAAGFDIFHDIVVARGKQVVHYYVQAATTTMAGMDSWIMHTNWPESGRRVTTWPAWWPSNITQIGVSSGLYAARTYPAAVAPDVDEEHLETVPVGWSPASLAKWLLEQDAFTDTERRCLLCGQLIIWDDATFRNDVASAQAGYDIILATEGGIIEGDSIKIASYDTAHQDGSWQLKDYHPSDSGDASAVAQCFYVPGTDAYYIDKVVFFILDVGTPTGFAFSQIYNTAGVPGTSAYVTGDALATSDGLEMPFTGAYVQYELIFSDDDRIVLTPGRWYFISFENPAGGGYLIDGANYPRVGHDQSTPTYGGNIDVYSNASWNHEDAAKELCFEVWGTPTTIEEPEEPPEEPLPPIVPPTDEHVEEPEEPDVLPVVTWPSIVPDRRVPTLISEVRIGLAEQYRFIRPASGIGPIWWRQNDPWVTLGIPGGTLPIFQQIGNFHVTGWLDIADFEAVTVLLSETDVTGSGDYAYTSSARNAADYFAVLVDNTRIEHRTDARTETSSTFVFTNWRVRFVEHRFADLTSVNPWRIHFYADSVSQVDT